ncbi:MAG: acyltransferase family protein [Aliidongia sp.]
MGLPVIATRHNGFPEGMIDGTTGMLVPEADLDGLAAGMIELAQHPEYWAPMGRAGRAFVRERFDQPALTAELHGALGAQAPVPHKGRRDCRLKRGAGILAGQRPKLEVINGLRGVAILAVIWHHLFGLYFKAGSVAALPAATGRPSTCPMAGSACSCFSCCPASCFTCPMPRAARRLPSRADALNFYRRRAARLLPLYYIVALLCLALNQTPPVGAKFGVELVSMGLVLFPFVNHGFEPYLNPPLWSLGVEIWFSVLFRSPSLPCAGLGAIGLLATTLALGCASRTLALVLVPGEVIMPLASGLTASLEIFAAGMVLAQWYTDGARPGRNASPGRGWS